MLKLMGKSKRGRQQIKRHGDKWMPVMADRCVSCLGGVPGIKMMSVMDQFTFWMKVEGDENLVAVERLDNFGRPIMRPAAVTADTLCETVPQAEGQLLNPEYGETSGRTRASGGSNDAALPNGDSADEQTQEQAAA